MSNPWSGALKSTRQKLEDAKGDCPCTDCSALEAENIALRSMCWAAAKEIESQWDHHSDEEGYGPRNLITRLNGTLAPDLYGGGVSKEDAEKYRCFKLKQNDPAMRSPDESPTNQQI